MTKVRDKQNIFDIALQKTGGLNNSARILRDNGLNFNDSIVAGSEIEVNIVESQRIVDNYGLSKFRPNNDELLPPAVGDWILEQGVWDGLGVWTSDGIWKTI